MATKVRGWQVGSEVFATRADAERHEARTALTTCLREWMTQVNPGVEVTPQERAEYIVEQIEADPAGFRDLIRPLITRKPKAPGEKRAGRARGKAATPVAAE